jgi:anti-sigma regulatory factor (Ser/Thr protein kinase)
MRRPNEPLRQFLLKGIAKCPDDIAARASKRFDISRQAVNRQLRNLVDEGLIRASGNTQQRRYELAVSERRFSHKLQGLTEDRMWTENVAPLLTDVPANVRHIWNYAVTEMINNAIDHSGGRKLTLAVYREPGRTRLTVEDDGIGIFRKIRTALGLDDERQAILELMKGKLTTDSARHTGEGIFFTSKAVDGFSIQAGTLHFVHDNREAPDRVDKSLGIQPGTKITMYLRDDAKRSLEAVFEEYASSEADYGFTRTVVPVFLAQEPDQPLISRSQAKRVLNRFERFKNVMLDFDGIESIGQAFADEIFRVYAQAHPQIKLEYRNASASVAKMIKRAQSVPR